MVGRVNDRSDESACTAGWRGCLEEKRMWAWDPAGDTPRGELKLLRGEKNVVSGCGKEQEDGLFIVDRLGER